MTETNPFRFDDVEQRVKQYIQHPYLVSKNVRRSVSRFHFEVLVALLQVADVDQEEADQVLDAALLLQHGLSIHDEVNTQAVLMRQLIVLAGDYSSSQYYAVLARLGNMDIMANLCAAVVKINQSKMALFNQDGQLSSEAYMKLLLTIHGELLFTLIEYYNLDSDFWLPHVESLVRAFVIQEEITRSVQPRHFTMRQAYEWLSDAINRIVNQTNSWFEPVAFSLMDSFVRVQKAIEGQTLAEENR